jgi:tetratricopeptide (TPR) repeat protein
MARLNGRRAIAPVLILAILLAAPLTADSASADGANSRRAAEADSLHRRAVRRLAEGTLDARRLAMTELERASLLDPGHLEVWLDLGRLCLESGQRQRGRSCYEHAQRVAPNDGTAHAALGMAWTWEWLASFEDAPLARAREALARACELAPNRVDTWCALSALELSRGRVDRAAIVARRGHAADPAAWEPVVAFACASYRAGTLARADSAFRVARGRVPEDVRARFARAVWSEDEPVAASWHGSDPDLTTPENEAELDYLTRLGLALLLFRDGKRPRWDMRAELFVRYGPPATVAVNPLLKANSLAHNRYLPEPPPGYISYSPDPLPYPFVTQVWSYPELGMQVDLWDRSLLGSFQLPVALESDPDPRPHPAALAARPDLVAMGDGRGVFRAMAPGSVPVPAWGQVVRFPADAGAILVAHLVTPGEPSDTLRGAWTVADSSGRVITRGSGALSASACDPTGQRAVDFTVAAPPGDYRVDLSVSGAGGRRGLVRLAVSVPPPDSMLALSDLVMLCGVEQTSLSPDAVRIEPDMARRVTGSGPLPVYFEIDRLALGADGRSRFAYTYSIVPVETDKPRKAKAPVTYQASREELHEGARRRQFVTVPMRSVKRGRYELLIEVRDLIAGTRAAAAMRFERD